MTNCFTSFRLSTESVRIVRNTPGTAELFDQNLRAIDFVGTNSWQASFGTVSKKSQNTWK